MIIRMLMVSMNQVTMSILLEGNGLLVVIVYLSPMYWLQVVMMIVFDYGISTQQTVRMMVSC